jgi:hypothetical protein
MFMFIFNKENGMIPLRSIPSNNKKKFFDMSKTTTTNPVLQRNGEKISSVLIINELYLCALAFKKRIFSIGYKSIT